MMDGYRASAAIPHEPGVAASQVLAALVLIPVRLHQTGRTVASHP
jgi:hypothetical protein